MPTTRQKFTNKTKGPFFIYVEMNPDCYKLAPGDCLIIVEAVPDGCNPAEIDFINEESATIWPASCTNAYSVNGELPKPTILINNKPVTGLSWSWRNEEGPRAWRDAPDSAK